MSDCRFIMWWKKFLSQIMSELETIRSLTCGSECFKKPLKVKVVEGSSLFKTFPHDVSRKMSEGYQKRKFTRVAWLFWCENQAT